jgi:hypothetical protein
MISSIFLFTGIYLITGIVSIFIIDTISKYYNCEEGFDSSDIMILIPFWPLAVVAFLRSFIKSFFNI